MSGFPQRSQNRGDDLEPQEEPPRAGAEGLNPDEEHVMVDSNLMNNIRMLDEGQIRNNVDVQSGQVEQFYERMAALAPSGDTVEDDDNASMGTSHEQIPEESLPESEVSVHLRIDPQNSQEMVPIQVSPGGPIPVTSLPTTSQEMALITGEVELEPQHSQEVVPIEEGPTGRIPVSSTPQNSNDMVQVAKAPAVPEISVHWWNPNNPQETAPAEEDPEPQLGYSEEVESVERAAGPEFTNPCASPQNSQERVPIEMSPVGPIPVWTAPLNSQDMALINGEVELESFQSWPTHQNSNEMESIEMSPVGPMPVSSGPLTFQEMALINGEVELLESSQSWSPPQHEDR